MEKKGFFCTIEGGEGSGKSTLMKKLENAFLDRKIPLMVTREPGGTIVGEKLRSLVLEYRGKVCSRAELGMFLSARAQHVEEKILPALSEGTVVLCDRYSDSSVAYQGKGRDLGMEEVEKLCLFFSQNLVPDLTIYLDLDPEIAFQRIASKKRDRIETEQISFHRKIREGFVFLAKKHQERFVWIDARLSAEEVFQQAWAAVEKKFFKKM